jgi:dTDP-4-amino-4,6-dideoxygalactose transaminase
MVLTNNAVLATRLRLLRSHGISSASQDIQPRSSKEIWNYQQVVLGFNYRMTDIHAALGLSQMGRLKEFVNRRHGIAQRYDELLAPLPVTTPWQHPDSYSAYHLYVIRLHLEVIGKTQRQVFDELRAAGVLVNLHYIPVYRHPYYEQMGFEAGYCPEAEEYFAKAISIPLYPSLTIEQQDYVVHTLREVLGV